ncbi:leucine-rich repeat domain-containing protein [Aestuariibius sp. HNIBRBA575]|uniref:leucine-rich repeat domain-containing protein n=1 Tax=Aestuariibius sp. HNIBRBA575 TaxID=3233343 RepID=UPI0034A36E16
MKKLLAIALSFGVSCTEVPPTFAQEDCIQIGTECFDSDAKFARIKLTDQSMSLDNLAQLEQVEHLTLQWQGTLGNGVDLSPLGDLKRLISVTFDGADQLDFSSLDGMAAQNIILSGVATLNASQLGDIDGLRNLSLMNIDTIDGLQLATLPNLEALTLINMPLDNLQGVEQMRNLTGFALGGTQVTDLSPLAGLDIRQLTLRGEGLLDLSPLSQATNLTHLTLNSSQFQSLNGLNPGASLVMFSAQNAQLTDIQALSGATNLERFNVKGAMIRDINPLSGLRHMQEMDLRETAISDISALRHMTRLEKLWITDSQVADLEPLSGLDKVEMLSMSRIPATDISPLAQMKSVEVLWVNDHNINDLSPLLDMPALTAVRIDDEQLVMRAGLPAYLDARSVQE